MNFLGMIILIIFAFFVGRIYEYRFNLRECENCKGEVGNE
ncbi:Uncharacterised protein [Clostridioides difficile]|nr:Uncharacterised protein [Clostridioides difficile]VFF18865.1 Uncharacterised protein [Clostridioides difficile]VFF29111.1 Uncharacterised protein [Clostridioides difficile]VIC69822.1 Uncharacterised protein [Clostridioides difficile]